MKAIRVTASMSHALIMHTVKERTLASCRQQVTERYAGLRLAFQGLVRARDPSTARSLDDPIRFMSSMFALREVSGEIPRVMLNLQP